MNVLYIAPRYHKNQIPIMRGWLESGHQVLFIAQISDPNSEDHSILRPLVLGFSPIFNMFFKAWCRIKNIRDEDEQFALYSKAGFPPIGRLKALVKDFKPDIAILRERSLYTIFCYRLLKALGVPAILYNQTPLWHSVENDKGFLWRMVRRYSPKIRMTPVYGVDDGENIKDKGSFFVPFVCRVNEGAADRKYLQNGCISFIIIARYIGWKKHHVLIDALSLLKDKYDFRLIIIGEISDNKNREYYDYLKDKIESLGLADRIRMLANIPHREIFHELLKADVFVLPSEEAIPIAPLEALSCGVPAVVSNSPGKSCYIKNGETGYVFELDNVESLKNCLEEFLKNPQRAQDMGKNALTSARSEYSFERYYNEIKGIASAAFQEMPRDHVL